MPWLARVAGGTGADKVSGDHSPQYGTQALWTEPVIHTMGRTLGGQTDLGDEEILKWKKDFTDLYSKLLNVRAHARTIRYTVFF